MTVFIFITHTKTFTYATKWRCICGCFTYASMVIYVCATGLLHWSNRFHKIFFGRVVLKLYGGRRKPYSIFLHMRNSFGRIMQTFCKCFAAQSAEHMRKSCIFSACAVVFFLEKIVLNVCIFLLGNINSVRRVLSGDQEVCAWAKNLSSSSSSSFWIPPFDAWTI